jgi:hypothetical protein
LKWIGVSALLLTTLPATAASKCRDSVRGAGSVVVGEGRQKASFHVSGVSRNDNVSGRLEFRDRSGSIRLRSKNLLTYEVVDADTRRLTFDLGGDTTAIVTLRDIGRRGRDDFFEISAGDYLASGNLHHGQVRVHASVCE